MEIHRQWRQNDTTTNINQDLLMKQSSRVFPSLCLPTISHSQQLSKVSQQVIFTLKHLIPSETDCFTLYK